jgi:peptidoglycan/xylan/chitin deacetylase (PgdA/CDA1 family)
MKNLFFALVAASLLISCSSQTTAKESSTEKTPKQSSTDSSQLVHEDEKAPVAIADAATILARKQVPVLCYHHIKEVDVLPKNTAGYTVTAATFKAQMKTLADSGYHTITPDQYYNYLVSGAALPSNPVMLTYDDTDEEQFSIAKTEMDKYGFKGVYFIMTISIGRPRYMTAEQIRQLSDEGHVIGCHTWDHHRTDKYIVGDRYIQEGKSQKKVNDWVDQLDKPKKKLEDITGKPVKYFAYPFGVWSPAGIPQIRQRDYKLAFQLATKRDQQEPLYTVRRVIVAPTWSAAGLIRVMRSSFP